MSRPPESVLWGFEIAVVLRRSALTQKVGERRSQMQVKDGMSEVSLTVGPSHTLREAAAMMVEKGTGAALVSDAESPTPGIVTERDLLISVGGGEDPDVELVGEHMAERVIAAEPDWSLERAAAEMSRRGVRHLVVFEEGDAVGVLSMRDIVRVWTSEGATSGMTPG
jgi:signal-transduction protein with cAMP-binding, CBS, and nucleotidyltransferase domain